MTKAKPYEISKQLVWDAYKKVKANRGAAGVDGQTLAAFEKDLKDNLYKIWNRMSSGCYFPPPVRLVEIPKGNTGKTRPCHDPFVASGSNPQQPEPRRDREVRQPLCTWLGELLWSVLPIGSHPGAAVPGTFTCVLGSPQVQTTASSSTTGGPLAGPSGPPGTQPAGDVANWNSTCDWTIRAG